MATTKRSQTPEEQTGPEPAAPAISHRRCGIHGRFFPGEDSWLPYTEFNLDPYTLLPVHDGACRRCSRERKRAYDKTKTKKRQLPPLERLQAEKLRCEEKLQEVMLKGGLWTDQEVADLQARLAYFAQREQDLLAAGQKRENTSEG